jgi:uncharacterized membrane protein HdeD (DUF308 family)
MATAARTTREPDEMFGGGSNPGNMQRILQENWWVIALRGILGIVFGLIALFLPGVTILSIVLVFAAYMLVDGAFSVAGAIRSRNKNEQWGWVLLNGVISIITAVLAYLWPVITALAFVLLVAIWSIVGGAVQLAAGFRMNSGERGRGWLIFGGILSILFGALLVISPLLGAIVLTWWLGAYILVSSILLLIIAFSVKSNAPRRDTGEGTGSAAPRRTG